MSKLISVVMSVYNAEEYIEQCICSILKQTYSNFEFIIIDDASTDNTSKIIEKLKEDPRIVFKKNDKNKGLTYNLVRGIEMSRGEYIARMDADDIALPQRLEKQLSFMEEHSEIYICGTWAYVIDDNNKLRFRSIKPLDDEKVKSRLICGNPITHSSVMMRKELFFEKMYDKSFITMQDFKLWIDCWDRKFYNIPEFLILYRINKKGISAKDKQKADKRINSLCEIYHSLFNILGIKMSDREVKLYARSIHVLGKFETKKEENELLKIYQTIHRRYKNIDMMFCYSRWMMSCNMLPHIQNIGAYMLGFFYRMGEIFLMIPMPIDFVRIKKCNKK